MPLLLKSQTSSFWPSSVTVFASLCQTWSDTPETSFLVKWHIFRTYNILIAAPACPDLANNDQYFGVTKVFGDGVSHGSVVKIMCPLNYELIGPQTVECVGGEWKMSLPTCERKLTFVLLKLIKETLKLHFT